MQRMFVLFVHIESESHLPRGKLDESIKVRSNRRIL